MGIIRPEATAGRTAWSYFPLPAPKVADIVASPATSCWIMPDGSAYEVENGGHTAALSALALIGLHGSSIPTGWMVPPLWIRVGVSASELSVFVGIGATWQAVSTLAGLCRRIATPNRAVLERRSDFRIWEIPRCRNPANELARFLMER